MIARVQTIQALRGLAAVGVLLFHVALHGENNFEGDIVRAFSSVVGRFGIFGVDLFFVISGVIVVILTKQAAANERATAPFEFIAKRIFRIYPLYWLSVPLTAMVVIMFGGWSAEGLWLSITWPRVALLDYHPVVAMSWTLTYEMRFYAVAAICLLFGRHAIWILLGWAVLHTGLVAMRAMGNMVLTDLFFNGISAEFAIGVAIGVLPWRALPRAASTALFLVGAVAALLATILYPSIPNSAGWERAIGYGLPAGLMVWCALNWESASGRSELPRWLLFAGDISYSVYMWHWAALIAAVVLVRDRVEGDAGFLLFLFSGVSLTFLVAWLSFRFVETPFVNLGHTVATLIRARRLRIENAPQVSD